MEVIDSERYIYFYLISVDEKILLIKTKPEKIKLVAVIEKPMAYYSEPHQVWTPEYYRWITNWGD